MTVRYTAGIPNAITSMYLSKPGNVGPPYTVEAINSYYISQHPCLVSQSVCCMNDYSRIYAVGDFANNISSSVGACNAEVQGAETLALGFDSLKSQSVVDRVLDAYPDSYVERVTDREVVLHIAQTDLSVGGLARKDPMPNGQQGYVLTFFVGITYFTLLPTNALGVTATQVQVQLTVTNSLTFSFASSQDYTFLKYITLSVIQTKWIDNLVEKHMQLVKIGLVLPSGMQQNMVSGLVPLNSIRFAVAKSLPSQMNASAWTNPCFSGDDSGLYDVNHALGYHSQYLQAQSQTCAARQNLCTNPTSAVLTSSLVNFFFPLGNDALTPEMLSAYPSQFFIYVYFQLSVLDTQGRVVVSNLFAKAQLDALSMSKACDTVSAQLSLLAATKVDIGIGLVGMEQEWDTTMRIFPDVTQSGAAEGANVDTTNITVPSRSIQSALISVVVSGSSGIFSRASASQFYIDIEQLSVMHFLDKLVFQNVVELLQANSAYSVVTDPQTSKPLISFSEQVTSKCNGLSCNLHNNIYGGSIRRPASVHSFATGIGTTSVDATQNWLLDNVLKATDNYSRDLAANMTGLVHRKFGVDDRVQKAWFVNPANQWTVKSTGAQSKLLLSDKLIMFAVIVLKDGSGNIMRRRLLSFSSAEGRQQVPIADFLLPKVHVSDRHLLQENPPASAVTTITDQQVSELLQKMSKEPRTGVMPPVDFGANIPYTLASVYGVEKKHNVFLEIGAVGVFDHLKWTQEQV